MPRVPEQLCCAATASAMKELKGGYACVLMSRTQLLGFRDPHGVRPLVIGQRDDGAWVLASEPCALYAVGAKLIRDRTSPPPSATLERRSARDGRLPRTLPAGGGGIDPFDVRGGTAPLLVSIDASVMRRCDMTVRKTATRRQRTRIHTQVT